MSRGTVYIMGPMRGIPLFNFPAFDAAEKRLLDRGWSVISPAALDRAVDGFDPESLPSDWDWNVIPPGLSLEKVVKRDMQAVMDSTHYALLPGWEKSQGVAAELALAKWLGRYRVDAFTGEFVDGDPMPDATSKPTNPKDAIGSSKLPLHLWPATATAMGCVGMLNGALKYGRSNFRAIGVRSSIYVDAAMRHLTRWFEGEECDSDDGVPHLAAALSCVAIIIDAQAAGKLNDDRMIRGGYTKLLEELTPHVDRLKQLHSGKSPKHYTAADNEEVA